jgi:hypothetical protein
MRCQPCTACCFEETSQRTALSERSQLLAQLRVIRHPVEPVALNIDIAPGSERRVPGAADRIRIHLVSAPIIAFKKQKGGLEAER